MTWLLPIVLAVTLNAGSKPGHTVTVIKHASQSYHLILPTNEALLGDSSPHPNLVSL